MSSGKELVGHSLVLYAGQVAVEVAVKVLDGKTSDEVDGLPLVPHVSD